MTPAATPSRSALASTASGPFGGMPATGAIARTATKGRGGGRTPVAGIVHALVILSVMLVAAPLAGYLAMPALEFDKGDHPVAVEMVWRKQRPVGPAAKWLRNRLAATRIASG